MKASSHALWEQSETQMEKSTIIYSQLWPHSTNISFIPILYDQNKRITGMDLITGRPYSYHLTALPIK